MSDQNQQTLAAYEAHVQEYIEGTFQEVEGYVKEWLDMAVAGLPKDARILEFGSAFGRDAAYLKGLGYSVECTDATLNFVKLLQEKGFDARQLNAITDPLDGPYDLVLANAVLLHFTRDETETVLTKVHAALADGGTFIFTLKQGEGEEWSDAKLGAPRYFCYWTEDQIRPLVEAAGFSKVEVSSDIANNNTQWLHIVATK
jgi:predicted TPR repeat methyltransferase